MRVAARDSCLGCYIYPSPGPLLLPSNRLAVNRDSPFFSYPGITAQVRSSLFFDTMRYSSKCLGALVAAASCKSSSMCPQPSTADTTLQFCRLHSLKVPWQRPLPMPRPASSSTNGVFPRTAAGPKAASPSVWPCPRMACLWTPKSSSATLFVATPLFQSPFQTHPQMLTRL